MTYLKVKLNFLANLPFDLILPIQTNIKIHMHKETGSKEGAKLEPKGMLTSCLNVLTPNFTLIVSMRKASISHTVFLLISIVFKF